MKMCRSLLFVLVVAPVAHSAAVARGTAFLESSDAGRMRPELVAKTLANVEDEWKQQALVFTECDTAKENCKEAPDSFSKSCTTVISAVVQGSGGNRNVAKEYMATVCNQKVLEGWHKLRCTDLANSIVDHAMSADSFSNRELLNPTRLCTSFWSKFVDAERKREAVEAKERAEREAKEAKERAEREKKEAQEAAEAKVKAEAEAKVEAERRAQEETRREQEEKEQKAKLAAEEAKARAAEATARLAQKKAEAEEVQKAAQQKLEEAEKAEQEHLKLQAEHQKAEENLRTASKAVTPETKDAKPPAKTAAAKETAPAAVPATKAAEPVAPAVVPAAKVAEPVAKAVQAAAPVAQAAAPVAAVPVAKKTEVKGDAKAAVKSSSKSSK